MQTDQLMLAAILFFAVSALFVTAANALKLGSIFGFLAAGIALGPHSPGPVLTTQVDGLLGIGELGVVLLMFTIGLEMQPARLWAMRRYLLGLGPLQVLLTGLLIGAALATTTTLSVNGAILVGIGLGLSSTAITMQVLGEKGDTATDYGKASFGILVLQDLASVLLLVLVPFLAITKVSSGDGAYPWWEQAGLAVAALGGVVLTGRYVLPYLLAWTARQGSTALFAVVVLVGVLVAALVMDLGGLSMAMGSFLLGILLSNSDFRYQVEANILPLKGLFLALFFVAVGMSIDIRLVAEQLLLVLGFVLLVVTIKTVAIVGLALLFGLATPDAVRAAFVLAPCSEFGFVLFAAAESGGLLGPHGFAIAVAVVSISMALTPFVVGLGYRLADRLGGTATAPPQLKELSQELENHVVVAGYGRPGRLMSLMLEKTSTPYIAFDLDLTRVYDGKQEGHNVHYGDVTDQNMQGAAAFAKARSVVVTLEDQAAAARLVVALRKFYPHLPIQIAAPDLPTQDRLRGLGAAEVVCTGIEGNIQLGQEMLRAASLADPVIAELINGLRDNDYALLRSARRRGEAAPGDGAA